MDSDNDTTLSSLEELPLSKIDTIINNHVSQCEGKNPGNINSAGNIFHYRNEQKIVKIFGNKKLEKNLKEIKQDLGFLERISTREKLLGDELIGIGKDFWKSIKSNFMSNEEKEMSIDRDIGKMTIEIGKKAVLISHKRRQFLFDFREQFKDIEDSKKFVNESVENEKKRLDDAINKVKSQILPVNMELRELNSLHNQIKLKEEKHQRYLEKKMSMPRRFFYGSKSCEKTIIKLRIQENLLKRKIIDLCRYHKTQIENINFLLCEFHEIKMPRLMRKQNKIVLKTEKMLETIFYKFTELEDERSNFNKSITAFFKTKYFNEKLKRQSKRKNDAIFCLESFGNFNPKKYEIEYQMPKTTKEVRKSTPKIPDWGRFILMDKAPQVLQLDTESSDSEYSTICI